MINPINNRKLSYCQAINEAIHQEMESDSSVIVYGVENKVFGSLDGLEEKFGPDRFFITPISEESMTGFGFGAAINGMRPIHTHIRVDFLILALNQIINMISSYRYGSNGKRSVPLLIRAVIGRGWGQGYQHSKSLQSIFAHIPGLKVIMPSTPYDAKGMTIAAIRDNGPVIMLEHRWLYWQEGNVPIEDYQVEIGYPQLLKEGSDITIVASSWMVVESMMAAKILKKRNISVEVIDLRTISPAKYELIYNSVNKTKYCIVADNDWQFCGVGGEIAALIYENCYKKLKKPILRIGFAYSPCPTARILENEFYPNAEDIIRGIENILSISKTDLSEYEFYSHENKFKGPF
jgi:pyruvate/2-oxoglutarate/acetoin dehydrogenase E1 component